MANLPIKQFDDDVIDIKKQSLFARLKRLFSTDVIVRNVGGKQIKIKDTDSIMYATDRNSLRDRFNRIRATSYNAYTRDFALSYQAARMDLFRDYDCVGPDTIIPLPDGSRPTIAELAEKYKDKPQERFDVFSYDLEINSITIGKAYHPRKKEGGTRMGFKVTLDNGQYVIGSIKHPFLMRNGEYKKIVDLKVGELVMPFTNQNKPGDKVSTEYKIISIESIGQIDVYDVTVEKYHNFATDSCFVSNTMDMDPILSSALDIYADECVHGDTIIPLLNGEKISIETLFRENKTNFWVYSLDNNGNFIPEKCERVACNGVKKMYNVLLDDGTELKCTPNHQWVKSDGTIVTTEELTPGSSLKVIKTKLSSSKFMNGYEMIFDSGKWKYTHRIVANTVKHLIEQRDKTSGNRVIHHSSFNKLNNDPNELEWMNWKEHKNVHAQFNKNLWADPTKNHEYKEKTRAGHARYWTPENREKVAKRQRKFMTDFVSKMTFNERVSVFANKMEKNGMFGNGIKVSKEKNGRWIDGKARPDTINLDEYEKDIIAGISITSQMQKYNILKKDCRFLNSIICKKYRVKRHDQVKYKLRGYTSFKDYRTANNHRVISIEPCGEYLAYDLVNVGNSTHLYAIETKDGSKLFTHNCVTLNELNQMLVIHSQNNNVKKILENLFYDVLNIEGNLWSWTRNMVKYGDFFVKLYIAPQYGIYMVEPISAYNVERLENCDPYNKRYVKFQLRPTDTSQAEVLENYEMAHFRLLSDSNFLPYGKCTKRDSFIDTEYGTKQICDIKKGENILNFNESSGKIELTKVKNVWCTGIKELLKIRTQHNFLECSRDHRFMVYDPEKNSFVYKIANDLKIKDLLVINTNKNKKIRDKIYINKTIPDDKLTTCPIFIPEKDEIPDIVNNEFSDFFGFMLGDGWIKHYEYGKSSNYRVCFSLGMDQSQNDYYISILEKYAGKKCNICYHTGNSRTAIIYSKRLYHILKNMGFGGDSKTKRIPEWVFEINSELQLSFINGFGNADGWSFTDSYNVKHYAIELCNKDLVFDFKRLLQLNNIKSSIPSGKIYNDVVEICGNSCNRSENWLLYYYLDSNVKSQYEKYKYFDTDEFILDPIRKIEDSGRGECWDIEVESSHHNFIANGIVVHNSMIEGARRVWKQLCLLEDAMLIHRIMRAPERRIFKIDVGNIPPNEVDAYMERLISKVKKVPYMDDRTGEYNLRFNLQNMVEDFYLPVRGGDHGTEIDTLSGMEWTGIEDLEYVKHKMMAALKIPKAFLGYDENLSGKASLACIVPETKIPLLSGEIKEVKQLIDDYNNGIQNYVYSIDESTNNIVAGEISWAGYTRMNTEVIRVHLDNKNYIDCTPDHKFLLRSGGWVEAKDLIEGSSLRPKDAKNHKVIKIEILNDKRDTCDITIEKYHNFATDAGVIIHNSEDIRFARTIQRIQRILVSELSKIAIVHLYSQGYTDEELVDFELELTNPSTIFEKEKIDIWSDKVSVATDMMDAKLFSRDWIYKTIFNLSDEDKLEIMESVVEDTKQKYRLTSIEEEGNDPAKPFQKINPENDDEGGGGDDSPMGDKMGGDDELGGLPKSGMEGDKETAGGGDREVPTSVGGKPGSAPPQIKEVVKSLQEKNEQDQSDRDQTGRKDARDYPFGEDPLGSLENNCKYASARRLKEDLNKPRLDYMLVDSLSKFLNKSLIQEKKELMGE